MTDMTETPARPPPVETVTYWAISILNSRTFWFNAANAIVEILSLTEVVTLIPLRYKSLQLAVVGIINIYLRTTTTRPIAFIPRGTVEPVEVAKLGPPPPPSTGTD